MRAIRAQTIDYSGGYLADDFFSLRSDRRVTAVVYGADNYGRGHRIASEHTNQSFRLAVQ